MSVALLSTRCGQHDLVHRVVVAATGRRDTRMRVAPVRSRAARPPHGERTATAAT